MLRTTEADAEIRTGWLLSRGKLAGAVRFGGCPQLLKQLFDSLMDLVGLRDGQHFGSGEGGRLNRKE